MPSQTKFLKANLSDLVCSIAPQALVLAPVGRVTSGGEHYLESFSDETTPSWNHHFKLPSHKGRCAGNQIINSIISCLY